MKLKTIDIFCSKCDRYGFLPSPPPGEPYVCDKCNGNGFFTYKPPPMVRENRGRMVIRKHILSEEPLMNYTE